eukprot:scaffold40956_cov45-Phaeocystis_antarctica.AAC.3
MVDEPKQQRGDGVFQMSDGGRGEAPRAAAHDQAAACLCVPCSRVPMPGSRGMCAPMGSPMVHARSRLAAP